MTGANGWSTSSAARATSWSSPACRAPRSTPRAPTAAKEVFAKYPGHQDRRRRQSACGARRSPAPSCRRSSPPTPGTRSTACGCRSAATPPPRCRTRPASPTRTRSPAPAKARTATASRCCRQRPRSKAPTAPIAPMGYPSISYASPPYSGALALKHAVEKLEGKDVPKLTTLPLPLVTNDTDQALQGRHLGGDEGRLQRLPAGDRLQPRLVRLDLLAGDARDRPRRRPWSASPSSERRGGRGTGPPAPRPSGGWP